MEQYSGQAQKKEQNGVGLKMKILSSVTPLTQISRELGPDTLLIDMSAL